MGRQLRAAPQGATPHERHQTFARVGGDDLVEIADQMAAPANQASQGPVLDIQREPNIVGVVAKLALRSRMPRASSSSMPKRVTPSLRILISSSRVMSFPLIAWILAKSANCFVPRRDVAIRRLVSPCSSTDICNPGPRLPKRQPGGRLGGKGSKAN